MDWIRTRPNFLRSSGTKLMPFLMERLALDISISLPSSSTFPLRIFPYSPNKVETSSVRPEPIKPAIPRISPSRKLKETPFTTFWVESPGSMACRSCTSKISFPGLRRLFGNLSFIFLPTMCPINISSFNCLVGCEVITRPSRKTVTVSAISNNSDNL